MLISSLLLLSTPSLAQEVVADGATPQLNAQLFRPSIDGRQTFWLNDAAVGESGDLTSRFLLQWVNDPLVYSTSDGTDTAIVDDVFQLDLMGGYVLGPVRVGLDLPVYLRSTGEQGGETGLGDIALDLKGAILDDEDGPLGLALGVRLGFPTATVATSLGNDGLSADIGAYAHKGIGKTTLIANLGTRAQPKVELENVTVNDQFFFGVGGGYEASDLLTISTEIAGHVGYAAGDPTGSPMELLPGASFRPGGGDLVLRSAIGLPLTQGIGAPKTRVLLALAIEPPTVRDADGDGIVDELDACPEQAEDMDSWQDEDGCPDKTEVNLVFVDQEGTAIPEASSTIADQTGTGDRTLQLEPGDVSLVASAPGFEDLSATLSVSDGAPTTMTITMDMLPANLVVKVIGPNGEMVPAKVSVKGDTYDVEGTLELERAPGVVRVDVAADGYLSRRLPAELRAGETTSLEVALEKALAEVTAERIDIKDSVYFETAKAVIKSESFELLDQVATIMIDHPEITSLRVEGHTDSRGRASYNLDLSTRRAASVLEYLVQKGVDRSRLESEGFGESKPIDPANNSAAWTKNRRVDFFIAERADDEQE